MSNTGHLPELESLRSQVADLARELAERDQAMQARQQGVAGELQDLRKQSDLLRAIMEGTAADTGDDFFASLATHLTNTLSMQYAIIGEVLEKTPARIRTLAVSSGGTLLENFEYDLAAAPCGTGLTESFWCFEQGVQALFPNFPPLAAMGVESHSGVAIRNHQGKVVGLIVVMDTKSIASQDRLQTLLKVFTPRAAAELHRKHAEHEHRQTIHELQNIMETVPDFMFTLDTQGNMVKWNRRVEEVTGYSPDELQGKSALAFVPPHEQEHTALAIQRAFTDGKAELEGHLLTKNQRTIPYHWTGAALRDQAGKVIGITGIGRDVTEQKQAAESLHRQRHHLLEAQALAHLGSWEWNIENGEVQWSDELYRIFGYEPGSITVTYDTFLAALLPDDHDRALAAINQALTGLAPYDIEYRIVRPDGVVRAVHARGDVQRNAAGHPLSIAGTVLDITDRTQIEAALRASEERWHLAVRGSHDGIWDWNIQTGRVFYSSRWKSIRGFADSEIADSLDEWRSRVHPDDLDRVLRSLDAYLATHTQEFCEEYRVQQKDGSYVWVLDRGVALWDSHGQAVRMVGSESDTTVRKQAEEKLLRTQFAIDTAVDAIYWVDQAAHILYANQAASAMLGYSLDQLRTMTVHDLNPDFQADRWPEFWAESRQRKSMTFESFHATHQGRLIPIEIQANFLAYGGQEFHCAFVQDITERKQAEQALAERIRLAEFAAEISLAINQDQSVAEMLDGCIAMTLQHLGVAFVRIWTIETGDAIEGSDAMESPRTDRTPWVSLPAGDGLALQLHGDRREAPLDPLKFDRAVLESGSLWTNDPLHDNRLPHKPWMQENGLRAFAGIPLLVEGRIFGVFGLFDAKPLSEPTVRTLESVCHGVAAAIARKQVAEKLRRSQAQLTDILENNPAVVYTREVGNGWPYTFLTPNIYLLLGYTSIDLIGNPSLWDSLMHPDDVTEKITHNIPAFLRTGNHIFVTRLRHRDGRYRWIENRARLTHLEDGPLLMVGSMTDITERKRAEEQRDRQYRQLQAIHRMTVALTQAHTVEEMYEEALNGIHEALTADRASILLFDEDGVMRFKASHGLSERYQHAVEGHSPWSREAVNPPPIVIPDVAEDPSVEAYRESFRAEGIRALGFIPLVSSEELLGKFMLYYDCPHQFTEEEIQVAQTIASHVVFMIQRQRAENEHHRLLVELAQSQKHFERLFYLAPAAIAISTVAEGRFLEVNDALVRLTGYAREELIGRTTLELKLWVDPPARARAIQEIQHKGSVHNKEGLLRTKSGEHRHLMISAEPIHVGADACLIYIAHDITAWKQAEMTRAQLAAIVESSNDAIIGLSLDGAILSWNRGAEAVFGYGAGEILGQSIAALYPPACFPEADELMQRLARGLRIDRLETVNRHRQGHTIAVSVSMAPILDDSGRLIGISHIVRDMTECKRMEDTLARRERELRTVLDTLPIGVWFTDAGGNVLLANPAGRKIWHEVAQVGLEQGLNQTRWWEQAGPMAEPHRWALTQALTTGHSALNDTLEIICHDGSHKTIRNSAVPVRAEDGTILGAILVNEDITARVRAEAEKDRVQALLQSIVENIPHMITLKDAKELRFVSVNRAGERLLGQARADLIGQTVYALMQEPEGDHVYEQDLAVLTSGQPVEIPEHVLDTRDHGRRLLHTKKLPIFDPTGQPAYLMSISEDITERTLAEKLLEAEKDILEAIALGAALGEVLGRVANRIESLRTGLLCSILLADADGRHLHHGAAPSLPASYTRAVDGLAIGPRAGSCGTAAFRKERVIVSDIETDPLWEHHRAPARQAGLRACWSTPICSASGTLLGTLALYYREPRQPAAEDVHLIERMTRLVQIAIERHHAERALQRSEERLHRALEASRAGTWQVDLQTGLDTRDAGLNRLLGLPATTTTQPIEEWFTFIHPEDLPGMKAAWETAATTGVYEGEHRLISCEGAICWVYDRGLFIRDEAGQLLYATGAVIDITERKRVEEALRQSERAVRVALDERERISQDLHDGILQSLYAVGLGLEACRPLLQQQQQQQQSKNSAKTLNQALDQAIDQLNTVMAEVRNFIAGLESQVMKGGDFPTALRVMAQTLTTAQPLRCTVTVDKTATGYVSTEQALHLMNIVREALSNSLRHGQATNATVSLKRLTHSIRLSISDNGIGFDPTSMRGVGHGLTNMAARARKVGGRFAVRSAPQQGTRITIDLPKETCHAESESEHGSTAARR